MFDQTSRRHRSHGARNYNKPEIHNVSFDGVLPFVNLQLGLHHIRTRLYSLPLNMLHDLYETTLTLHFADVAPPEHRLQGIILDISSNRLFKAVRVYDYTETKKNRPFLKIKFANKGIDALNFSNILNQKSVQSHIPPYFQNKESPCISYGYTCSVAPKIFNYNRRVQQIDLNSPFQNPLPCTCSGSEFLYVPCGHVQRGDLGIVRNKKNLEIFYTKARNSGNLSHFYGTRTLISSLMHVKCMPGNGPRERMSNSTLVPNGLSRLMLWLNAGSDFWNILSTPDPVSMRNLL